MANKLQESFELIDKLLKKKNSIDIMSEMVDSILNEVENSMDNDPGLEEELYDDLVDDLSKDEEMKDVEEIEDEIDNMEMMEDEDDEDFSISEAMKESVKLLVNENDYQDFFREKMKKWNISSPSQLSDEDKSSFFKEISRDWKKKK